MIGLCYYYGKGCSVDAGKAVPWLIKSALQYNSHAQNLLGVYYRGLKDFKEASKWFDLLANQIYSMAQYDLGWFHFSGLYNIAPNQKYPDAKNIEKANELFTKAANQGNSYAMFHIGNCYIAGHCGFNIDSNEAMKWYERAKQNYNEPYEDPRVVQDILSNVANGVYRVKIE